MYCACRVPAPGFYPCSVAVCGDCVVMGKVKELTSEQITAITSLCKAGKSNKEIASITGVSLRSVQRWTKKFRDCGNTDPPLPKKVDREAT